MFLILGSLLSLARAAETVFVAPFVPIDPAANDLANNLPNVLFKKLQKNPMATGLLIDTMEPVHDDPAKEYMSTCPVDELVGCAFVIGKGTGVSYAVVGTVTPLTSGGQVAVTIVDIKTAEEVFQLELQVVAGGEDAFAETISRTLTGLIDGTLEPQTDIRSKEKKEEQFDEEDSNAADENWKQSGAKKMETRLDIEVEKKSISDADLEYMMSMEGSKEWERLGMSPKEYQKYFNSGMSLAKWQKLNKGRKGDVIFRADVGVNRGPLDGYYYGTVAKSNADLSVIDLYAWQTLEAGTGVDVSFAASYGLNSHLDVGLMTGATSGTFQLDADSFVVGQFKTRPNPEPYTKSTSYIGLQGLYAPLVMPTVRPLVGAQMMYWNANTLAFDFGTDGFPNMDAAKFATIEAIVGGEMQLSQWMDVYIHSPTGFVVWSKNAPVVQQQNGGILSVDLKDGYMAKVRAPERFSKFSTGINIGVQFHVPLKEKKKSALEMYE